MPTRSSAPFSENSEEARALLQTRVALFWKVMFFIMLLSSGLGAIGAVAEPGLDLLLTLALSAQAGIFWGLCRRGRRSVRFSQLMEGGGLLLNLVGGACLGRYILAGFARDHALSTSEGRLMADAYVSMLQQGGTAMLVAIRAALIPSSPRRTLVVTAVIGAPVILANALLVPGAKGGLSWRPAQSAAYPWMPVSAVMMWGFAIIMCTVITWVIYGLRSEVRDARRLGQYVLESKIGEGGMGEVYRARHGMMRRPSALKLMRLDQAGSVNVRRFEREVQLTARLTHPNTITIFDYGRTAEGVFYYAMELLDGANLQRIVSLSGPQHPGRVVRILAMACGALSEAHAIGLIHRDIKPANIMLCTQGGERDVVKLLDFGLVKELELSEGVALTGATTITGTPQYMAPEAILTPDAVDARTDIYALGLVAYYLLAGSDVFNGASVVEICAQHLHQPAAPFATRGIAVPADLESVVLACLAKEPELRPQTAGELRSRLEACAVEPWDGARARQWWLAHQHELDADSLPTYPAERTIAVDRRRGHQRTVPRTSSLEPGR